MFVLKKFHNMSKFFTNLDFPELPKKYIQEALNSKFICRKNPTLYLAESSFNETSLFKVLDTKFGNCHSFYSLNPPNSLYDWHIDVQRKTVINWVIKSNPEARTYYREPITESDWNGIPGSQKKPIMWNLTQVKYDSTKPTLLDISQEHCVINDWPEDRIILSLCINELVPYQDVLDFLGDKRIKQYS